ncbi:MAG: Holliday junction branch migration protein RuvA [Chlamydiota bacterium]
MLDYIKGALTATAPGAATLEIDNIGYRFFIPLSTYTKLPPIGETTLLYITTIIREDSHRSFGFLTREERELFEQLSAISGIGPKTALALIGHLEETELKTAITTGNTLLLSKVPGIGKKTAERLIIELRDKVSAKFTHQTLKPMTAQEQIIQDAISALTQLGYHPLQAERAIKKALVTFDAKPDLSLLITTALKKAHST